MKHTLLLLAGFILVVAMGCSSSSRIVTGVTRPEISPEIVQVFPSPPGKFEEVAMLSVESAGWSSQGETDRAISRLKKEAAALGANGILLTNRGAVNRGIVGSVNPQTGAIWASSSSNTLIEARAIYVSSN